MDVMKNPSALLLRAASLIGVLVALTLVINLAWFDEDLHPDLVRLKPAVPVSMEDNAYPLMYGFTAADERDSLAAGLEIIQVLRDRFANEERAALTDEELAAALGTPPADEQWRDLLASITCNSRFELDCADRLIADIAGMDRVPPRLQLLLERYEDVLRTARFAENQEADVYTPIPDYGQLMTVARIRLAISFNSTSTEEFLFDVSDDVALWKAMLRDGQSLIAKMVALAGLRNDAAFLSTLIRQRSLSAEELESIARIFTPLTSDERDIGETFLSEVRMILLSSKDMAAIFDGPPWMARFALQEQATINEYYLMTTTPMRLRASLSAEEFFRQRAYESLSYDVRAVPPPLYNLGGKFILRWMASTMNIQEYISRVHDLDGRIALVLLQSELAANPSRSVADVVRSSVWRNPYTGEAMDYDSRSGTVGFECVVANEADVCAVSIE